MTLLLLRIPQDRTSVGWAELQRSREWLPPPRTTCPQFVSENLHGGSVHPPQITIPVTSCQPQGLDPGRTTVLDQMTAWGGAVDQAKDKAQRV